MNTYLQTPTPRLRDSLDYYAKLGMTRIANHPNPMLTDGSMILEINPDRYARAGVKIYRDSWEEVLPGIQALTAVTPNENGYALGDGTGAWIYLRPGPPPALEISGAKPSILRNFAGLSLETTDLNRTAAIWQAVGFTDSSGSPDQGWMALRNPDNFVVSLMRPQTCPHLFFNPSLTYFNGKDNLAVIQKVRDLGIPIAEEITYFNKEGVVDNIILRDPGGLGMFVFND